MQGQSIWLRTRPISIFLYAVWLRDVSVAQHSQRRSEYLDFYGNYPKRLFNCTSRWRTEVKAPVVYLRHQVPNPIANRANMEKELRDGEKHEAMDFSVTSVNIFLFSLLQFKLVTLLPVWGKYSHWHGIQFSWKCLADTSLPYPIYIVPIIHGHGQTQLGFVIWTRQQHKPVWGKCQMKPTSTVVSTKVTRECNIVPMRQHGLSPSELLKSASLTVMFIFIIHEILCFLYLGIKIDQLLTPTLCMHKNLTMSPLII